MDENVMVPLTGWLSEGGGGGGGQSVNMSADDSVLLKNE